jgi:gliding motility associated protien GldN
MKRAIILMLGLSMFVCGNTTLQAQDNITEVYVKEHIPNKKPVPYPYIREADVMWAKIIWRVIDLREKMNMPLYYPIAPIDNRLNLITLLLYGIDNEGLTAYSPDDDLNEFKVQLTKESIDRNMGAENDTVKVPDPNTGELIEKIIKYDRRTDQVKQVLVKEKWFFDRQHSTMQVRIIGVCPIRMDRRTDDAGNPTDEVKRIPCFWIYYPEARNVLANHEVYNRYNDAQHISFDDFFYQRRFNSYISKESNVYSNRSVSSYASGVETLYESERIKDALFNMEHDLWEY